MIYLALLLVVALLVALASLYPLFARRRRLTDGDILEGHERSLEWQRYKRRLVESILVGEKKEKRAQERLVDRRAAAGRLCTNGVWRQQRQEFVVRI